MRIASSAVSSVSANNTDKLSQPEQLFCWSGFTKKSKPLIDTTIIAQIKKRNTRAFKGLYDQTIAYVYSIVRRYVSNDSDHKDVIQEIFTRVFLSIGTYDEKKGAFKFWLRRLVINQCMQHYRKQKMPLLFIPAETEREVDNSLDRKLSSLSTAEIEQFLVQMPIGYRQVFLLIVIDEHNHKEVGELLGISEETSRSQLSRAKKWIRKNLFDNQKKNVAGGF